MPWGLLRTVYPSTDAFRGGAAALLGPTGGYLLGFLAAAMVWWLVEKRLPASAGMILGLLVCYLFGTVWYCFFYLGNTPVSFFAAVARCVLPYLVPDGLKLGLALLLTRKLKQFVYLKQSYTLSLQVLNR